MLSIYMAQTGTGGGSALTSLLPFLLLALAFWLLILRPQRRRAQEAARTLSSLRVGAEVITTAGLYGTVAHVDDDAVLLQVAPGVTNRYAKAAVARVLSAPEDTTGLRDDEADADLRGAGGAGGAGLPGTGEATRADDRDRPDTGPAGPTGPETR